MSVLSVISVAVLSLYPNEPDLSERQFNSFQEVQELGGEGEEQGEEAILAGRWVRRTNEMGVGWARAMREVGEAGSVGGGKGFIKLDDMVFFILDGRGEW